jgi:hypothetical protein
MYAQEALLPFPSLIYLQIALEADPWNIAQVCQSELANRLLEQLC